MTAAGVSSVSAHLAHIVLFAVWFGVIVAVLLVDHVRTRLHRHEEPVDEAPAVIEHVPALAASGAHRISMATWPPPRPALSQPRGAAAPRARAPQPHRTPRPPDPAVQSLWLPLAVIGSLAAAAVHVVVLPDHIEESYLYGAFFAAAATAQAAFAFLLARRPTATLFRAGAAGSAAVIALWAYTRVVGVPIGPGRGATESVGGLDVVATTAEAIVLVACLVALLRRVPAVRTRLREWSLSARCLTPVCAVAIVVAALVSPPS